MFERCLDINGVLFLFKGLGSKVLFLGKRCLNVIGVLFLLEKRLEEWGVLFLLEKWLKVRGVLFLCLKVSGVFFLWIKYLGGKGFFVWNDVLFFLRGIFCLLVSIKRRIKIFILLLLSWEKVELVIINFSFDNGWM